MHKKIKFNIFFILLSFIAGAQSYRFKQITSEDGLSTNYIQCILQDKMGFMWFGTQEGLCRYDGYNVTTYKHNIVDKSSMSSSDVVCIYEHKDGKIYVGTRTGGLNIFDRDKNTFERIPVNGGDEFSLTDPKVCCILELNDENIFIGTGNGLNVFNTRTKKINHILFSLNEAVPVTCLNKFNNILYIGTSEHGLWILDKTNQLKEINLVVAEGIKMYAKKNASITKISNYGDKLYLAYYGEGIVALNPNTFEVEKVRSFGVQDDPLNAIINFQVKGNKIFAATKTGFIIYDLLSDKAEIIKREDDKKSLNDSYVTCTYIDSQDNIWLGTFTGGVNVSFAQTQKFPNLPKEISELFKQTNCIYEDKNKRLWIGGEKSLKIFNRKTLEVTDLSLVIEDNYVLSIIEGKNDNFWLGTYGRGLIKYNASTKKSENVLTEDFGSLAILTEFLDDKNNLWLGTYGDGFYVYNTIKNTFDKFNSEGFNNNITCFFKDADNNMWLGSDGGGAYFVPKGNLTDKKAIINYAYKDSVNSLTSNTVYSIYQDKFKNIWFATVNGLCKYDLKTKKFNSFTEENGLANNFVLSVLPDSSGNLWMSTNKGIAKFNPNMANVNGNAFKNYDQKDGLLNNEYMQGAFCKSSGGEMIFGSSNGINIFNPSKIIDNFHLPEVYIVAYKRSGNNVITDTSVVSKKYFELSYRENFFQFELAALDYNSPLKNKYMYKLEGYDNEWSAPSHVRFVSYTELPGGDYVFKVKAANNDGVWNEVPYQVYIKVIPPFWKTKWFYILVSVFGITGIVLFTQYRTRAIKKENKILELKVEERTKELAEKNRDITSSIQYAKRIQEAILPAKDFIFSKFNNAFILYQPKDIVSGDFYWFGIKNNHKIFAVVDCTGHGVPGAFMSMIGHNLVNQIVLENSIIDPAEILNNLHHGVQEALKQGRNEINTNDGMDVSIISVNENTGQIKWAGAFRPLLLIRADGVAEKTDGNKYSIGGGQLDLKRTFTSHEIKLNKNDTMYLFSDGYADQFGGEKGKKFMVKRFNDLLCSMRTNSLEEQKNELQKTFEQWRGNHEQVDDVLVVGIRI